MGMNAKQVFELFDTNNNRTCKLVIAKFCSGIRWNH